MQYQIARYCKIKIAANKHFKYRDTRVCERFLSEYATENPAEFIAEAFSSTENNDLVLEVKRLLKKKWGM